MKLARILAIGVAYACCSPSLFADHPVVFPWSGAQPPRSAAPMNPAPYRVLPRVNSAHPAPVAIQTMPPKTGYAYGWFGSNPTPQVSRHLGFHQNFTQWSYKP